MKQFWTRDKGGLMDNEENSGNDRALMVEVNLRPGRQLYHVNGILRRAIPPGFTLQSVRVKAYALRDDNERGRK